MCYLNKVISYQTQTCISNFYLGRYKAAEVNGQQRTDGARWHQGIITGRSKSSTGQIIFSGNHTKGSEDGKWCTYKDYRILVIFSEFFYTVWCSKVPLVHLCRVRIISKFIRIKHFNYSHFLTPLTSVINCLKNSFCDQTKVIILLATQQNSFV